MQISHNVNIKNKVPETKLKKSKTKVVAGVCGLCNINHELLTQEMDR